MIALSVLLAEAAGRLRGAGVDTAMADARALLAHAASIAPDRLTLHLADPADAETRARFDDLITRRVSRVPVSHLVGKRLFWGRSFAVTADVLDPRPETEVLVAEALRKPFVRVADLGTGSGCILLSLLAERPGASGVGVDLSRQALAIAQRNATALSLTDRVTWAEGSWFDPISGQFDLIVSNPPYIAAEEMASLSPEVRLHEPHLALTDAADGLTAYRAILAKAPDYLKPSGRLLLEIGPTQAAAVVMLAENAGLRDLRVVRDFDGRDRVVAAVMP